MTSVNIQQRQPVGIVPNAWQARKKGRRKAGLSQLEI